MRIYIKEKEGKTIRIPLPLWVLKLGCNEKIISFAMKHTPEKDRKYVEGIDFQAFKEGIDILKNYKGLKIVDIKDSDGTEVSITV